MFVAGRVSGRTSTLLERSSLEDPDKPGLGAGTGTKSGKVQVPSLLGRAKGRFVLQLAISGRTQLLGQGSRALASGLQRLLNGHLMAPNGTYRQSDGAPDGTMSQR